ncbi:hypothetical protein LKO27_03780 [Tessaracoccus sp. OS52]|uniref:hypothetical protein n=1 Tax=Tessaracoccus sp. OS52 TaxID=2886691 RepID=UPI001D0FAF99|nr:hypothetical protein [Tessaracoccus sp. OS52]MCC2592539.1 hypothetical protein [Tessaracoccus sp. OS52]
MNPNRAAAVKLVAAAATIAAILVSGLALAFYFAFTDTAPAPTDTAAHSTPPSGVGVRDRIAEQPMPQVSPEDATGGTPALVPAAAMTLPPPTVLGPAGIPAGFPNTAEGAIAQLAQILVSALGRMDLEHAREVREAWFEDPDSDGVWPVMLLVQRFLEEAGMPLGLEAPATLTVAPVGAQVKGSDGPDWTVACVLLDVTYTHVQTARMAYGHCERMAWTGGRWVVAEGSHPPPAPSTWPGTDLAREAGWLTWVEG